MARPKVLSYTPVGLQWRDYSRDLRLAKWGLGVRLNGSNLKPPMSALGQKQTFETLRSMSALPPKADIRCCSSNVRFVPKADILRCSKIVLFVASHLIAASERSLRRLKGH